MKLTKWNERGGALRMALLPGMMALTGMISGAWATETLPDHWIDAEAGTVHFAPLGRLSITYKTMAISDSFYGQLAIDYVQDRASFDANEALLKEAYPNLKRVRGDVLDAPGGKWKIVLPDLSIEKEVKVFLEMLGPSYQTRISVPKSLHAKVRSLVENGSLQVMTEGKFGVRVPVSRILEEVRIPSESCSYLTESGSRMMDVLAHSESATQKAFDGLAFKFASTEKMLRSEYLLRCLSLSEPVTVRSFKEMTETRLELNPSRERWIKASTRKRETETQEVTQRAVRTDFKVVGGAE